MISEESCDTEDWSNDAESSALITEINDILTYIHIETVILNSKNILQYCYFFYCISDQTFATLVSIIDKQNLTDTKLLNSI